jgi:crotonobetainyl-CoA:carnitine CoA-transferase CaiB-like acyl-CoA transferase
MAGGQQMGPLQLRMIYPASDGFVALTLVFGSAVGPFTRRLMELVCERGFCDEATRDKDWIGYAALILSGAEPLSEFERVKDAIATFTASQTKAELFRLAQARALLIAPVADIDEVLADEHLVDRGYWQQVVHPELEGATFRYPGPFAKFSRTPIRTRRRPPLLGEHTTEILAGDLGIDTEAIARLRAEGVAR